MSPANSPAPLEAQSPISDCSATVTPTPKHVDGGEAMRSPTPTHEPTSEEPHRDNATQEYMGGGTDAIGDNMDLSEDGDTGQYERGLDQYERG